MNRGKTSWAEAVLGETIEWLVEEQGFDESEIAYVYAEAVDIKTIVGEAGSSLDLGRCTTCSYSPTTPRRRRACTAGGRAAAGMSQ